MKNSFEHNLIKGRIAEMVFALMLREAGGFTVLPFGYEDVLPSLVQYQSSPEAKEAMLRIRRTPDFVVINKQSKLVHLVEVKYRSSLNKEKTLEIAKEIKELWDPSWLFIATPKWFYSDPVDKIVKNEGKISKLPKDDRFPKDLQEKYLKLLNDFEKGN